MELCFFIYLDDISMVSATVEEHIAHVNKVLRHWTQAETQEV